MLTEAGKKLYTHTHTHTSMIMAGIYQELTVGQHWVKHFPCIITSSPFYNPVKWILLFYPILQMRKLRLREEVVCPRSNS